MAKDKLENLKKDIEEINNINKNIIANLSEEDRTQLYNLKEFYNKHTKECKMIEKIGIDNLIKAIEIDQSIKKNIQNNSSSK